MARFQVIPRYGLAALIYFFCIQNAIARDIEKIYDKARFKLGKTEFTAYLADDEQKRAQGLMFVDKMRDDMGMLFVFEQEDIQGFWMKNTLIPLSIGFFNAKGKLVDTQEMKVAESLVTQEIPSYRSARPAIFALEMNAKWFGKHKIKLGTQLELLSKTKSKLLSEKLPSRH